MSGKGRVLVGTSGSPGSLQALRYGEGLAGALDAVLVPVLAWEMPGGEHADRVQPSPHLRQAWPSRRPPLPANSAIAGWHGCSGAGH